MNLPPCLMRLLAWIVSRYNGRVTGDVRYVKALPCAIGDMRHFLPHECWTDEERNAVKYCANKQRWNGFGWDFVERLELSRAEWQQVLGKAEGHEA